MSNDFCLAPQGAHTSPQQTTLSFIFVPGKYRNNKYKKSYSSCEQLGNWAARTPDRVPPTLPRQSEAAALYTQVRDGVTDRSRPTTDIRPFMGASAGSLGICSYVVVPATLHLFPHECNDPPRSSCRARPRRTDRCGSGRADGCAVVCWAACGAPAPSLCCWWRYYQVIWKSAVTRRSMMSSSGSVRLNS